MCVAPGLECNSSFCACFTEPLVKVESGRDMEGWRGSKERGRKEHTAGEGEGNKEGLRD